MSCWDSSYWARANCTSNSDAWQYLFHTKMKFILPSLRNTNSLGKHIMSILVCNSLMWALWSIEDKFFKIFKHGNDRVKYVCIRMYVSMHASLHVCMCMHFVVLGIEFIVQARKVLCHWATSHFSKHFLFWDMFTLSCPGQSWISFYCFVLSFFCISMCLPYIITTVTLGNWLLYVSHLNHFSSPTFPHYDPRTPFQFHKGYLSVPYLYSLYIHIYNLF